MSRRVGQMVAAAVATTALSVSVIAPAGAEGPPPEVVTVKCDNGRWVLVVKGRDTGTLPGHCFDGAAWSWGESSNGGGGGGTAGS